MRGEMGEATMQERYRTFRRAGGNFYARDKVTGQSESLETSDRTVAKHTRSRSIDQYIDLRLDIDTSVRFVSTYTKPTHHPNFANIAI